MMVPVCAVASGSLAMMTATTGVGGEGSGIWGVKRRRAGGWKDPGSGFTSLPGENTSLQVLQHKISRVLTGEEHPA
ncbi:MAG: hypothetical protein WC015_11030, partial [Methanoregula sp.]